MIRRNKSSACDGLTLIELLMAISILVIMMSIAYGALSQLMRSKVLLDDSRDASFLANAVLNRLIRELQLAYSEAPLLQNETAGQRGGIALYFSGEKNTASANRRADRITFVAQEGGQYLPDGGTHSGLVQISYRLEEDPERRRDRQAPYYLVREELPYIRPVEDAYEKILYFPVADNIESLEFSYFDGQRREWTDSWGNPPRRERLPTLVRLTLKTRSKRERLSVFTTIVPIQSSASN